MDESYVRLYPDLERTHFWWRIRQRMARDVIAALTPGRPSVLDVGCGSGVTLEVVSDLASEVTGVEIDPAAVPESSTLRDRIRIGALDKQSFPDDSFDVALLMDVIEHVEDPIELLAEVHRVLSPRGTLFVTVPAFRLLWSEHDDINHHYRRYNRQRLSAELEAAGFVVERSSYFFFILLVPKLILKLLPMGEAEMGKTDGAVHRLMASLVSFEYWLYRHAPSLLVAGTSVVAVARKP